MPIHIEILPDSDSDSSDDEFVGKLARRRYTSCPPSWIRLHAAVDSVESSATYRSKRLEKVQKQGGDELAASQNEPK